MLGYTPPAQLHAGHGQTGVKTLPWPKLSLRVAKNSLLLRGKTATLFRNHEYRGLGFGDCFPFWSILMLESDVDHRPLLVLIPVLQLRYWSVVCVLFGPGIILSGSTLKMWYFLLNTAASVSEDLLVQVVEFYLLSNWMNFHPCLLVCLLTGGRSPMSHDALDLTVQGPTPGLPKAPSSAPVIRLGTPAERHRLAAFEARTFGASGWFQ